MDRVTELLAALPEESSFYTFELFPPKTSAGLANLLSRLERLAALRPSWFHVTWGGARPEHWSALIDQPADRRKSDHSSSHR